MEQINNIYNELSQISVEKYIEKKLNFSYLSWADCLDIIYKKFNDNEVQYYIHPNPNRDMLPIFGDGNIGYFVKTTVTIKDISKDMTLPVLDMVNNPMKDEAYTYLVYDKYKKTTVEKRVEKINSFEINKTIMRCIVKNFAVFGLGICLYKGDDLTDKEQEENKIKQEEEKKIKQEEENKIKQEEENKIKQEITDLKIEIVELLASYKYDDNICETIKASILVDENMSIKKCQNVINKLRKIKDENN